MVRGLERESTVGHYHHHMLQVSLMTIANDCHSKRLTTKMCCHRGQSFICSWSFLHSWESTNGIPPQLASSEALLSIIIGSSIAIERRNIGNHLEERFLIPLHHDGLVIATNTAADRKVTRRRTTTLSNTQRQRKITRQHLIEMIRFKNVIQRSRMQEGGMRDDASWVEFVEEGYGAFALFFLVRGEEWAGTVSWSSRW